MKQSWYISAYALFIIFVITRVSFSSSSETLNVVGSKFFQNTKQSILDKTHNKENRSNVFDNQVYVPQINQLKNTLLTRKSHESNEKEDKLNKSDNLKNESLNSEVKSDSLIIAKESKLKSSTDTKKTFDTKSNITVNTDNNSNTKSQPHVEYKTRVAYGGFFDTLKKNSKDNENLAWKALATFLGGIACFFISIHVTCWNERRAVKEVEFTDWIAKAERCGIISNGLETEKIESTKSYIVSGELQLQQAASIPNLNIDYTYGSNRHLIIKYEVEHFTIYESTVSETNADGECVDNPVERKIWVPCYEGTDEKYKTRTLTGTALISGKYKVNLEKLSHLVETNQTRDIADNKFIQLFNDKHEQVLLDYFKQGSNPDLEIKVICDNQYVYIIRKDASKVSKDTFIANKYQFSTEDRRIKIKYVSNIKLYFI
jgi:hypothetical protein